MNARIRTGWRAEVLVKVSPETPEPSEQLVSVSLEYSCTNWSHFLSYEINSLARRYPHSRSNFSATQPGGGERGRGFYSLYNSESPL